MRVDGRGHAHRRRVEGTRDAWPEGPRTSTAGRAEGVRMRLRCCVAVIIALGLFIGLQVAAVEAGQLQILPPNVLVGYGLENFWQQVDPNWFGDQLVANGLNFTDIEYVPAAGGGSPNDPCHTIPPPGPQQIDRQKALAFVQAMRSRGIWTFINIWNANSGDASFLGPELDWINANIGSDKVIVQAASEWNDGQPGIVAFANNDVPNKWPGYKAWNKGAQTLSAPPNHMIEYHPCDAGPLDGNLPKDPHTLVTTDCGALISYFNDTTAADPFACFGPPDRNRIAAYAQQVLQSGPGIHFMYYGFQDSTPESDAMAGIRDALG